MTSEICSASSLFFEDRNSSVSTQIESCESSEIQKALEEYKLSLASKKPGKEHGTTDGIFSSVLNDFGNSRFKKKKSKSEIPVNNSNKEIEAILMKSVITPNFEQLHAVPPYEQSEKKLKELRKREREKTKGKNWFGMKAPELTDELKNDLEVLQMRSVLDPKHFYKKNDLKVLPKYFQVGKVLDTPLDYYNNRLTKKERKKTLVDELLADAEFNKYNKRKYKEIIEEKQKTHYKAYRQAKKLKKKNKK